jgi:hypothetical protein
MIDTTLAELGALLPNNFPALCNITARIAGPPNRANNGARWEVDLETPSGTPPIRVAVHINAPNGAYGYTATDPNLLRIFEEPRLRALIARNEIVTVQAVPRWSETTKVLYLNVEAIFLVRPWRNFGRREIDYSANCSRKHYLAVTKGARAESEAPRLLTMHGLAGEVAHDIIETAAHDLNAALAGDDEFIRKSLSPALLLRLVVLGLSDPTALASALARGTDALKTLRQSAALTSLLKSGGPWYSESDQFDRGVTMAPDLIGDRIVLELKRITPNSFETQREKFKRQIESYLAWAMVRFGIDPVVANWRASLVNLHPDMPDETRMETVTARRDMIGGRIYRRHRLIALLDGNWLPAPTPTECSFCEFHNASADEPDLPPICQYHCQAERGWECQSIDGKGTECPLYELCDCHSVYESYERPDHFNRLRRDLLIEEEDSELAVALTEEGARVLGQFSVIKIEDGIIRLAPDPAMAVLDGVVPGVIYTLRSEQQVYAVRFRRLRDGQWCFSLERRTLAPLVGTTVELVSRGQNVFPMRAQLAELDRTQRSGAGQFSKQSGGIHSSTLKIKKYDRIALVPPEARCLVVDSPEPLLQREALREFFALPSSGRQLVLTGPSSDSNFLPSDAIQLDDFSVTEKVARTAGSINGALHSISGEYAVVKKLVVPWDMLFDGLFDVFLHTGQFTDVVILDAHAFPMFGLRRCFELASNRVVLVGSQLAAGPWAETSNARASLPFQNPVRLLIETQGQFLPKEIDFLAIVHIQARAARSLGKMIGGSRLDDTVPVEVKTVEGRADVSGTIELISEIETIFPQQNRLRLKITLDPRYPLALRETRQRLRHVSSAAIEQFRPRGDGQPTPGQGSLDQSLIGVPVRLVAPVESLPGFQLPRHEVRFLWPRSSLPLTLSEGLINQSEAVVAVDIAASTPERRFIITSPFVAQCRAIAKVVANRRLDNIRVTLPEKLGHRRIQPAPHLIVSLAATDAATAATWPLNDLGQLAPLLIGDWSGITILCAPALFQHHPVIRHLARS